MVILKIYVKPIITALGQPIRKRLPASDRADPQIPHRSRGKRHHHGDDVCVGSCVCVDGTFCYYSYCSKPTEREFFVPT
jgi:hypothetical protein